MARQKDNISAKFADSLQIHENLDQHAWIILEDKVRLTLIEYEKQFERTTDWWSPLSILVTIIATIITTNFVDFFSIPAATIRALFYFAAIYFAWQTIVKIKNSWQQKKISIEDVIQELRESSERQKSAMTSTKANADETIIHKYKTNQ